MPDLMQRRLHGVALVPDEDLHLAYLRRFIPPAGLIAVVGDAGLQGRVADANGERDVVVLDGDDSAGDWLAQPARHHTLVGGAAASVTAAVVQLAERPSWAAASLAPLLLSATDRVAMVRIGAVGDTLHVVLAQLAERVSQGTVVSVDGASGSADDHEILGALGAWAAAGGFVLTPLCHSRTASAWAVMEPEALTPPHSAGT